MRGPRKTDTKPKPFGPGSPLYTEDPSEGATLECGHIMKGGIAGVGQEPFCFSCKARRKVVKAWER